jgi:hypothetical protein
MTVRAQVCHKAGVCTNGEVNMTRIKVSCCVASAALLLAIPVVGSAKDDYGCNDVNFSQEILKQLPKVRDACQDVKMKGDKVYAHFVGEVVAVDSTAVTVRFKDRAGKDVSELMLAPTQEVSVTADGKDVPFSKLERPPAWCRACPVDTRGDYSRRLPCRQPSRPGNHLACRVGPRVDPFRWSARRW